MDDRNQSGTDGPRELIAGMRRGDDGAWQRFLRDYGRLIYAVAMRFRLPPAAADDHFQDVCLAVFKALDKLRDPDRLSTWVFNIASRRAIDMLRRERVRSTEDLDVLGSSTEPRIAAQIIEEIAALENVALIHDALARLDERCRQLLSALFLEDPRPSYTEISRREQLPVGSIGPVRARCLHSLQKIISRLSDDFGPASDDIEELGRSPGGRPPRTEREGYER